MFTRVVKVSCSIIGSVAFVSLIKLNEEQLNEKLAGQAFLVFKVVGMLLSFVVFWILTGLIIKSTPKFAERIVTFMNSMKANFYEMVLGFIGLIVGLVVANLITLPIRFVEPFGTIISLFVNILLGYTGFWLVIKFKSERIFTGLKSKLEGVAEQSDKKIYLLDTSVIIDGRILDVIMAGFFSGHTIVPFYVIEELGSLADSADSLKRLRGKRGLDNLDIMVKKLNESITIESYIEIQGNGVDEKLINHAKVNNAAIITNDFNLKKIAEINGLTVLSINSLSNALKLVAIPGEEIEIFIVKEGKETGQGVAYLDGGTMVIIEDGSKSIGKVVHITITSILQTQAGKMVFGKMIAG